MPNASRLWTWINLQYVFVSAWAKDCDSCCWWNPEKRHIYTYSVISQVKNIIGAWTFSQYNHLHGPCNFCISFSAFFFFHMWMTSMFGLNVTSQTKSVTVNWNSFIQLISLITFKVGICCFKWTDLHLRVHICCNVHARLSSHLPPAKKQLRVALQLCLNPGADFPHSQTLIKCFYLCP